MPTYQWHNTQDGRTAEVLAAIKLRDIPPDDSPGWERLIGSPTVLQASFLDGQRSRSDPGYAKLKEAAKLKVQAADYTNGTDDKRRINREIDALERIKK